MHANAAVLPANHRPSAFRRFPPGCGRHHNAAAGLPPRHPLSTTAAAAAAKTKPPLPKPSSARAANKTAPPPARRTIRPAACSGTQGLGRDMGNGKEAAAAVVTVRRASAVRRYPPGCGRGVAVSKPVGEGQGEAGAGKPTAAVGNGDANARPCDLGLVLRVSALDHAEFNSDDWAQKEGGVDAGAQEEGGGKPWVVSGLMAVPFLPWAQHGRRSQRLNA